MKKKSYIILFAALVVLIAGAAVAYNNLSPEVEVRQTEKADRKKAPNFITYDEAGKMVKLSSFKGKPVVINFWATWCGYCVTEFPAFEAQYNKYKDDVQFLMIDLTDGQRETVEKAKAFIEEEGYTFPVVYDTNYSAAQAYGVQSVPMTVFVDADGNLADIRRGAMSESELEKNITELIGG